MSLLNLTPHPIHVHVGNVVLTIPPQASPARVSTTRTRIDALDVSTGTTAGQFVPIYSVVFGLVEGLPDPVYGTRYIVSRIVFDACPQRTDLLVPDEMVRDTQGQIIGCASFAGR